MDAINEQFRANLIRFREAKQMGVDELSLAAGLNRRAVRDIEERRSQSPKLSTIVKLAEALEIDPADLIGRGGRPKLNDALLDYLAQYDEDAQARLLQALETFPPLSR